jgi:Flp pilus assembly protein TadD
VSQSAPSAPLTPFRCAAALLLGGALAAGGSAVLPLAGLEGAGVFVAHLLLPAAGLALAARLRPGRVARAAGALALLAALLGTALWLPVPRAFLTPLHAAAGFAAVALGLAMVGPAALDWGRSRRAAGWAAVSIAAAGPALAWFSLEARRAYRPPRYAAEACFRFLTATTVEQAGEPGFPSALRVSGRPADCAGCHPAEHAAAEAHAHANAGGTAAYRAALAAFRQRRGAGAGRWCQGCHSPGSLRNPTGEGSGGVDCNACHGAREVRAVVGSAPLTLAGAGGGAAWEVALRPGAHARANGDPALLNSAEFCAGCHRKHYGLPQTQFRWLPGLDPYREWLESAAGGSVFAPAGPGRTCTGCHAAHGAPPAPVPPAVRLHVFLRQGDLRLTRADLPALRPGTALEADVVLVNPAAHAFPAWMPDLHDCRLEVEALGPGGAVVGRSDPAATLRYELDAWASDGTALTHADLDRAVRMTPHRRIPAGEADIARYRLTVPPGGLTGVRARLWRRPRAGGPARALGEAALPGEPHGAAAVLQYGQALTGARSYPEALRLLREAESLSGHSAAVSLALGRLFLEEGDRLAALEQFRRAAGFERPLGQAWQAVVLRRSGRPDEAARLLEPLLRSHPRDPRLRFELGRAYMDLLRHEDAARQFQALLDVDPLDPAGHYNLRLCLLRLNRFAEARREEALYRLLGGDGEPGSPAAPHARPLQVFSLREAPR